jgi:hypothetical protein
LRVFDAATPTFVTEYAQMTLCHNRDMSADNSYPIFVVVGESGETQFININHIAQILVPETAETLELVMSHGERIALNLPDNRSSFMRFVARNAFTATGEPLLSDSERTNQSRRSDGFQTHVNIDPPRR